MRIVVIDHVTLDGVVQGPGAPDEDTRDGFDRGGWAVRYGDEVMGRVMGERTARSGALLLGRRTYEQVLAHWNAHPNPQFTPVLNETQKYVVSTTLREPLPWPNSTLVTGDVPDAIRALKAQGDGELGILGSGALIRSLLPHDVVDEYLLTIHPIVLGQGHRLFPESGPEVALQLVDATPTSTGVIIATYRPA
jgi:dihydrofolate reductase